MPHHRLISLALAVIAALLVGSGQTQASDEPQPRRVGAIEASSLQCEYRKNPLGIDARAPRLSWKLLSEQPGQFQTAYQIIVAESLAELHPNGDTLWNTGRVDSDQSVHVVYKGAPLESRQRCYWTVRVWDRDGRVSLWGSPSSWEMGLLDDDDWRAAWISDGRPTPESDERHYESDPAPMMRREFAVRDEVARARLYITGLGYYDATMNGRPVSDEVLNPIWTEYRSRVYYNVFDVTELLESGTNAIGLMVGNGWFNPLPLRMWGHLNLREHLAVGRPRVRAQLEIEYTNGHRDTIATDARWTMAPGPIVRNNIYLGEVYDARQWRSHSPAKCLA